MTIQAFPWATIGQVNDLEITEISHSVNHVYGGGYNASRPEGTKIQKELKLIWDAMTEAQWLALITFWRSVIGISNAFYIEYPVVIDDWDYGDTPTNDPDDGFDLALDDSTTDAVNGPPVFLVNFTERELKQVLSKKTKPGRRYKVITSVREVA